ncbi:PIG-L family deacetylase [Streptomyces albiaxialis]|uniref:PIG-L family deacetylase n=1 Tax=Streptomyces albiaxialis TaxID=329523 RepID=A0ABN2VHH9_9ACTN
MSVLVAFHAHPDDEVLLTGGTLARAAAEGHRVVVVVAADGLMGPVPEGAEAPRLRELRASAGVLGVARVVHLGYADSGHGPVLYPDPPDRRRFVRAPLDEAAGRLAAVLAEERADVLLGYDPNGGYGHPDHVRVHEVARRAAALDGGVRLLEATIPRDAVARLVRLVRLLRIPFGHDEAGLRAAFSPREAITHRIRVGRYARRKRDALAAHTSAVHGHGRMSAVWRALVRLPAPAFALVLGREWYVEVPRT